MALLAPVGAAANAAPATPTGVQVKHKPTHKPETAPPDFGPNVTIFDPSMSTAYIKSVFDEIHEAQVSNEMGTDRYGLYFMPGTYGSDEEPLQVKVGYYTEVAGLGASPGDVQINGAIEVYNQCFDDPSNPEFVGCFALNNFWRGLSNLTINVNTAGSRRLRGLGQLLGCVPGGLLAAGGHPRRQPHADGLLHRSVLRQRWLHRRLAGGHDHQRLPAAVVHPKHPGGRVVQRRVEPGLLGRRAASPDEATYPDPPYTTLEETPLSREKPYLYVDDNGKWMVRVPSADTDTRGISWDEGMTAGRSIPLSEFYVADPDDPVKRINRELARGKQLILTPGVYDIDKSITVKRADTVVLGMGLATLDAVDGAVPMRLFDRQGIIVAGITIDAGAASSESNDVESPFLLQVGKPNGNNGRNSSNPANPTTLSDVYFRVGGPHTGKVDIALEVNSDHVLIDHTWVWRGDHGIEDFDRTDGTFGDNERWRTNIGRNGVVVNGDDVTATGYFVEHFQEYNSVWNGERGRVLLFQNELPYDPPTQAEWTADDGTLGWAGYKVADDVKEHELWGGGVYVFNRNNPSIVTENGYEVPDTPGVVLNHIMTNNLSGPGTINSVVNGFGDTVDGIPVPGDPDDYEDPSYVIRYSDGVAILP